MPKIKASQAIPLPFLPDLLAGGGVVLLFAADLLAVLDFPAVLSVAEWLLALCPPADAEVFVWLERLAAFVLAALALLDKFAVDDVALVFSLLLWAFALALALVFAFVLLAAFAFALVFAVVLLALDVLTDED